MISIVIPALEEAENLRRLLPELIGDDREIEIIVADGGSSDGTAEIAREHGAKVLATARGRGAQLAAGGAAATGDIILFLHADSGWPKGGLKAIRKALGENPKSAHGNFRLLFDGDDGFSRWLKGFYAFIRWWGFYYGDSGIFIRADAYRKIGGIKPIALMEDYDLVRRLRRTGRRLQIKSPPLVTSSRRFRNRHPIAIVGGWVMIHILYWLGVSPEKLARLYRSGAH
jgi:rSAM/selenodomain-associated transferase 2